MINKGQSFFPVEKEEYTGITQRDMLAAMAMQGMVTNLEIIDVVEGSYPFVKSIARASYILADAMIEVSAMEPKKL